MARIIRRIGIRTPAPPFARQEGRVIKLDRATNGEHAPPPPIALYR
jgi:hypothetical protein